MSERARTIHLDDQGRRLAEEVVRHLDAGARLALVGASGEPLALTGTVRAAVATTLASMLDGDALVRVDAGAELTPDEAATILGISRALVDHRMDSGRLPFRSADGQRRVPVAEVLKLRAEDGRHAGAMRAMYDAFDVAGHDPAPRS